MKCFLLAAILAALPWAGFAGYPTPDYSIQAIRYASAEYEVATLVTGAPKEEKSIFP